MQCGTCTGAMSVQMRTFRRPRSSTRGREQNSELAAIVPVLRRKWIERRSVVLTAALIGFVMIYTLSAEVTGEVESVGLLYVVPISLVALELGPIAGAVAAALSLGLVGVWSLDTGVNLSLLAFVTRAVAYVLVGALAGVFGHRMRGVHARQILLLDSGLRLAHLDASDELLATLAERARRLVSASWARAELIDGTAADAGDAATKGIDEHVAIEVRDTRHGTLTVRRSHAISGEDLATLEMLALQAAIAAENRWLLESERERLLIRAELQDARLHLAERGGQLRELLVRQEAERNEVAHELNEQAAQSLAAVLLGLAAVERELGSATVSPRLGALRSDVDSTIRLLRNLAVSLRPPALQLGLRTALERLADAATARGFGQIEIDLEESDVLGAEADTMVYRAVEETLAAVGAASRVSVRGRPDGSELLIDVDGAEQQIANERLAVLRARLELVGGTLTARDTELRVSIPLPRGEVGGPKPAASHARD